MIKQNLSSFLLFLYFITYSSSTQLKKIPINENNIPKISKKPSFIIEEDCDLITEGAISIENSERILLPNPLIDDLSFYYSFDHNLPLDQSGKNNHPIGKIKPGISFGGNGNSALFDEGNYLEIETNDNNDFSFSDFTITFWFYLLDFNQEINNCPIIYKGNEKENSFSISINKENKQFLININGINSEEKFESQSKIVLKKWTHISLIKKGNKLSLYINGILDTLSTLKDEIIKSNDNPLFIGNIPSLKEKCISEFMIDEIRFYKIGLDEDYIQAEASASLGGIEPSFIKIGCLDCTLEKANSNCNEGYKLCTSLELHIGGYQVAKSLGLINSETYIWTHNALENENKDKDKKGLGLCCKIIN
jgi:hypothetical protein